ncbi:MAG: undecaprenyl-diphosphate phosphatase [Rickettsiales bacterium]|jgi:undecaprenyl-diphosphatase|nr:undecaprenyl-diphosphate phosphatase [Rickettsiales bacterium]
MDASYLAIYSIIQGLTEFLPVSSSAHLMALDRLWGPGAGDGRILEALAHIGSLMAIIIYSRARIWEMARGFFAGRPKEGRTTALKIAASFAPIAIAGALASSFGQNESAGLVAFNLVAFGLLLWGADRFFGGKTEEIGWRAAMAAGLCQMFSVIHGASRSGSSMIGLLASGASRKAAAEFSLLMAIPAIAGAGAWTMINTRAMSVSAADAAIVVATSFAASLCAVSSLIKIAAKFSFAWAAAYRAAFALLLLKLF